MKLYVKIHSITGAIEQVSPVPFANSEEIELDHNHPFLQELMQGIAPGDWKYVDGEFEKYSAVNCTTQMPAKINLTSWITLLSNDVQQFWWKTPWTHGIFFTTHPHDTWHVLDIFQMSSTGEFATDREHFQLFSITHNDEIWKKIKGER